MASTITWENRQVKAKRKASYASSDRPPSFPGKTSRAENGAAQNRQRFD
ncbi:MAG: hypothetical protein IJR99_16265 [Kiritimatiellae bacterium]|nr:hypothetical protein [Kiritimatiellia bacterium]